MAAVAVPIILHLLNLQKVQKMEFSTLMFLKEIQKSRFRKLRIKHFLLMLVRTAIIVFLVFAFADPFLSGYSGKGTDIRKLGVLFIDSSYSMLAKNDMNDSTSLYFEAEMISDRIKNLYYSTDELLIFKTSVQTDTSHESIHDKPGLNSILNKTNKILKDKNYNVSEIFVINDFQKINYNDLRSQTNSYSNLFLINVARSKQPNISINSLDVESRIIGLSIPAKIKIAVSNFTDNYVAEEKIELYSNNILLEEKYFNLNPNESKQLEFFYEPNITGFQVLKAELVTRNKQLDAFAEDNTIYKRIYIPERINIGIISDSPEKTRYIKAVFDAANKNTSSNKVYNYIETSKIEDLSQFEVAYICGKESLSEKDIESIYKLVDSGKRVLIFPNNNVNMSEYSNIKDFQISSSELLNSEAIIENINKESEIFREIFKSNADAVKTEKFRVDSYYRIAPLNTATVLLYFNASFKTIPFILSAQTDKLLISAVSSDLTMSTFPKHSLFAPFVLRSAYTFNSKYTNGNMSLGERDTLESNPEIITEDELETVLDNVNIDRYKIITGSDLQGLENTIEESRKGKTLWFLPLVLALGLIPIEIYLSSRSSTK